MRKFFLYFVACAVCALAACGNKQTSKTEQKSETTVNDSIAKSTVAEENEMTYFPAIDRYLQGIGSQYAKGDLCIPCYSIVDVDETNADDILVWGDFWVFNYNQVGDTLKTVSGGSHPGMMHIRQTEKGFEVTGFDQVVDGSEFTKTAKKIFGKRYDAFVAINSNGDRKEKRRKEALLEYVEKHSLPVTTYQDYGWPPVKIK